MSQLLDKARKLEQQLVFSKKDFRFELVRNPDEFDKLKREFNERDNVELTVFKLY